MAPSKSKGSGAKGEEFPDICTTMKTHLASAVDHADKLLKSPELDPLRKLHAQHLKNILTLAETHIKAFRFMPKDADSLPRKR